MAAPTKEEIAELWRVHESPEAVSERLQRSYGLDSTRAWVREDGYTLSDRLWNQKQDIRQQIDQVLRQAIADGEDALSVADKLEQFLDPAYSPVRTARGTLKRNQRRSIVTKSPGRGGAGSAPARTLVRTEISRAHAQGTLFTVSRTPFSIGVRWAMSHRHSGTDICNNHATQDNGLGSGVYNVDEAPTMPSHPNCLCRFEPVVEEDIDKVVADLRVRYRLDEP